MLFRSINATLKNDDDTPADIIITGGKVNIGDNVQIDTITVKSANDVEIIFETLPTVLVSEQVGVQLNRSYPNNIQFPTYNTGSVSYISLNEQPVLTISNGIFTADMAGGTITVSNPTNPVPTPLYPISTTAYVSKIKKIL